MSKDANERYAKSHYLVMNKPRDVCVRDLIKVAVMVASSFAKSSIPAISHAPRR
jgi:uncharacterized protein with HEPN domain